MTYIPHIVVLALIFVMPAWDALESRRLKASADSRKRVKWYAKLVVASWLLAALVAWISGGWRNVATIGARAGGCRQAMRRADLWWERFLRSSRCKW